MTFVKYPKTMHLPWSPGLQNDDKRIETLDHFKGREVIVTEKMDGENTTMYADGIHARSIDGRHHSSRDWVKAFHGAIKYNFPSGPPFAYRVCGENMCAEHSIRYESLETYFYGFSFWTNDYCWCWDDTLDMFEAIGITPVPTIWRGPWEEFYAHHEHLDFLALDQEGYVVRVVDEFHTKDFQSVVAKYVREDHVQTDEHWMSKPVVPNGLRADKK